MDPEPRSLFEPVPRVLVTTPESAGYDVVAAPRGDKAHEIYRDNQGFGLLVTEIVMRGPLQGTHLARKLRALNPDLPVILCRAMRQRRRCTKTGCVPRIYA